MSLRSLRQRLLIPALALSLLSTGLSCTREEIIGRATNAALGAGVGFVQSRLITPAQEVQMGEETRKQVLQQYRIYTKSPELVNYVKAVGAKVAQNAERKDELNYRFDIVESDEINAFTIPGGSVFITPEALKYIRNEAELAGVLGHELGHNEDKHALESLQRALVAQGAIGGSLSEKDNIFLQAAASVTLDLILKGFSRSQEKEADITGANLATSARYDEEGLLGFLETLQTTSGGDSNGLVRFLLTHPATGERITLLKDYYKTHNIEVSNPILGSTEYQQKVSVLGPKTLLSQTRTNGGN